MKPEQPIRIGIIGAGAITKSRHLPGLKKIPDVQLVAVCNRSAASGNAVAREWGFERVARSPRQIIHATDIDAVMIGVWPYLHHTLSCAALSAGKHVFTQARMARNLNEARMMLAAARRHPNLVAMICPSPYVMKCALFVQDLIRDSFVGAVRLVRFHSLGAMFADPNAPIHWRQQTALNGVNTLSFGIVMERFLQWFGPVTSVQAAACTFTRRRKNSGGRWIPVTVPDQLQAVVQLRDHPGQLSLSFSSAVHHAPSDVAEIYGDRGTLLVDFMTGDVSGARHDEGKLKRLPIPAPLQRDWTVEADFIDAIRAGGRERLPKERTRFFPPDFEEGVRYMAVTEAAIRSARSGKREPVAI
ncbi:MAG: Gfo/Idh/MocA family oxidoreductase [Verrucomicrobia bacterium]|nr:Gfo/Idh/MocA family oxidoreductase [Verrucomicrobiota bacterium]